MSDVEENDLDVTPVRESDFNGMCVSCFIKRSWWLRWLWLLLFYNLLKCRQ